MWCVGDCLQVFTSLYMLEWMRFDWWVDQCALRKDIAPLSMQVHISKRKMTKTGLHMHQYVHNYRTDILATLMDCWPSLSKALESVQTRIISSSAAQQSFYYSMSLIKLEYIKCQKILPICTGASLSHKHYLYIFSYSLTFGLSDYVQICKIIYYTWPENDSLQKQLKQNWVEKYMLIFW